MIDEHRKSKNNHRLDSEMITVTKIQISFKINCFDPVREANL